MSNTMPRFTLGEAFYRRFWLTLGIDAGLLIVCCAIGFMYAHFRGLISAACGFLLAFIFSEFNSYIAQILDYLHLTGKKYMSGLIQLWVVKILLTVTVGALIVIFVPLHIMAFCTSLAGCAAIIVLKNIVISARARVL